MKKLVLLIFLISVSISGYAYGVDSIDWGRAQRAMQREQYQEACSLYHDIYINHAVKDYRKINSVYVDDLRKTYSIDELELSNNIQRNRLLNFIWITSIVIIFIITTSIFYLRRQNQRIVISKKELEEAKAFAEESIQNKSLLLSNMSHEIRTPLNALAGFSEVLSMEDLDDETRHQSNEIIRMNSDLLQKLINDIVNISCVDMTNMAFNIQPCDVIMIGKGIVKTIAAIKRTEAAILFESDLKELVLETDSARLQQLLINLLVNATKFTKVGSITLKIEKADNDTIQFSVTDTGCGIPLESQSHIFDRFEKLNEHVQGTGIGLSICQLIVNRLGGKIGVDSSYTAGARFVFSHPLKQKGGRV